MAKGRRKVPGINASSTADISFILLIFFLVVTSMSHQTGLNSRLPEKTEDNTPPPKILQRNVLAVNVNMHSKILVKPGDMDVNEFESRYGVKVTDVPFDKLRWIAKDFICNQITDANGNVINSGLEVYPVMIDTLVVWKDKDGNPHALPDRQPRRISKNHVITLTTDRASEYSVYFKVANELYGAYNELRNQLAEEAYGRAYEELDGNQQEVCQQYYKMKIYEAKPQEHVVNVQQ